jgi:hypothetical protein
MRFLQYFVARPLSCLRYSAGMKGLQILKAIGRGTKIAWEVLSRLQHAADRFCRTGDNRLTLFWHDYPIVASEMRVSHDQQTTLPNRKWSAKLRAVTRSTCALLTGTFARISEKVKYIVDTHKIGIF